MEWLNNYIESKKKYYEERIQSLKESSKEYRQFLMVPAEVPSPLKKHKQPELNTSIFKEGIQTQYIKKFPGPGYPRVKQELLGLSSPKQHHTTERTTETYPTEPNEIFQTERRVESPLKSEKRPEKTHNGPVKISLWTNLVDEEKKKIHKRRAEYQKKILTHKNKSDAPIRTEDFTSSPTQLTTHLTIEDKAVMLKQTMDKLMTPFKVISDPVSGLNQKIVIPEVDHYVPLPISTLSREHSHSPSHKSKETVLRLDSRESPRASYKTFNTLQSIPTESVYEKVVLSRLTNTYGRYPLDNEIDVRSKRPINTGPTLFNSTFSRSIDTRFDSLLPEVNKTPSSSKNMHVLRMREAENAKSLYHEKTNSRSQKMKFKTILNNYFNEGAISNSIELTGRTFDSSLNKSAEKFKKVNSSGTVLKSPSLNNFSAAKHIAAKSMNNLNLK